MWEHYRVRNNRTFCLVLAWLVAIGLVLVPFAASSIAAPKPAMAMMGEMPCCPDQEPAQQDSTKDMCADCATMIVCALKSLEAFAPVAARPLYPSHRSAKMMPGPSSDLEDIGSSPPARPPEA